MPPSRAPLWLGAALLLVAVNLRLPLAGVPPIVDDVRATRPAPGRSWSG